MIGLVEYYIVKPKVEEVVVEVEKSEKEIPEPQSPPKSKVSSHLNESLDNNQFLSTVRSVDGSNLGLKIELGQNITQHSVQYEDTRQRRVVPPMLGFMGPKQKGIRSPTKAFPSEPKGLNRAAGLTISTHGASIVSVQSSTAKSAVTPGRLTRFNNPVPENDPTFSTIPRTKKGQRRSLSYANAVSATGVPLSFLEWTKMLRRDSQDLRQLESATNEEIPEHDYDIVTPSVRQFQSKKFTGSPSGNVIFEENESGSNESIPIQLPSSASKSSKLPEMKDEEVIFYDAYFLANDEEFLEKSEVRKLFRANALSEDDAKLFELAEYTGKEEEYAEVEIIDDEFLCDCCFPTREALDSMNPCLRFLHMNKCVLIIILATLLAVGFALLLIFLRPQEKPVTGLP